MSRTDSCFKSTRPSYDLANDTAHYYNSHHNTGINKDTRGDPSSIQYTKIRNRNSNFNPAFYGKSNVISLRKDMDPDWEEKKDCMNAYPTLSRAQQMESIPVAIIGRNGARLNDIKSIQHGVGGTDRSHIRLTANEFLASKRPMKQSSGVVF